MSDELDDYEEGAEQAEAREDELEQELTLGDAEELGDIAAEQDDTRFDVTRLTFSGVEEGDGDIDVQELEEAGVQLDDPECEVQIVNTEATGCAGTTRHRSACICCAATKSVRMASHDMPVEEIACALLTAGAGSASSGEQGGEQVFHTTAGPLDESQVGDVLAHHHMFVELGAVPPVAYLDADPEMVYEVIGRWVEDAKALGIGVFIEFTPEGVGRRPDIVKYVADRAELPTMLVTGIYREPFMPDWVYGASVAEVADFMRKELGVGVTDTGVPAGFIKLSQNDTGMTLTERKVLEAACVVAQETNAAIASHITAGPTALSVMDALEGFGCPLDEYRFVWVHAQVTAAAAGAGLEGGERRGAAPGMDYLLAAVERGVYVSLDGIGSGYWGPTYGAYDVNIAWIQQLADAGYEDQIIIGADTGWFDPGVPEGFEIEQVDGRWTPVGTLMQDYRSIPEEFVPAMAAAGFSSSLIQKLMHDNPWRAFSR